MVTSALAVVTTLLPSLQAAEKAAPPPETVQPALIKNSAAQPVTLSDKGAVWIMDNGIVRATIDKKGSRVASLVYQGKELMGPGGKWEQVPGGQTITHVTVDPKSVGGAGAEVSIKGEMGGKGGKFMDLEIRFAMERGTSGFYTYAIYTHKPGYTAGGFGESRFLNQLDKRFDWLSVDSDRNQAMAAGEDFGNGVEIHAKEQHIMSTGIYRNSTEHKYNYCAWMYSLPAFGWSSIQDHIGVWFINPSNEYIGGGPTRIDLMCHLGATMLDYWTSGHYAGGASADIPAGEEWNKVVGPIFCYVNGLQSGPTPSKDDLDALAATSGSGEPKIPSAWTANANALFQDALAEAKVIKARWPFPWVQGVDYPQKAQRTTVSGQVVLSDPQATSTSLPNFHIGLTHPDYLGLGGAFAERSGNGRLVTWQHDAKYYQFWTVGSTDGSFSIENVRPGVYTLHAFADGVLGDFTVNNVVVQPGKPINLGKLKWTPERYGKQVWEIGYPNRTSSEFFKGDGKNYWLWGWPLRYPLLFPHDLTYTIGKSDPARDWFFEEVPHGETTSWLNPAAKDPANQRFGWVQVPEGGKNIWPEVGHGRDTVWTIKFTMPKDERGRAVLRVALGGADGGGGLGIGVNNQKVGVIYPVGTNALRYNTDRAQWRQYTQAFDASLLKSGENTMQLVVPAGDLTSGVVYDYLRLELDETADARQPLPGPPLNPIPVK
ncbi:MAG: polysaccharide lyase family protein [Chthoniobacteraceae bacterium]